MNRRLFLGGLAAGAVGLLVPAAPRITIPERRYWALDRTMAPATRIVHIPNHVPDSEIEAYIVQALTEVERRRIARREWTYTISSSLNLIYDGAKWEVR